MNLHLVSFALVALAAGGLALTSSTPTAAQEAALSTVTVTASGTVLADPSFLSLRADLKAHAEVGEEAVRDFAQARTRALAGLGDAGLEGIDVQGSGVTFLYGQEAQPDPFNGMVITSSSNGVSAPDPGITCKETLDVHFAAMGDAAAQRAIAATALDVAVELGLKIKADQPNPYVYPQRTSTAADGAVVGGLDDAATAEAEGAAQLAAMDRARGLAQNLAQLAGRPLGAVHSIKLNKLDSAWKGVGQGVETNASITVTFVLQ